MISSSTMAKVLPLCNVSPRKLETRFRIEWSDAGYTTGRGSIALSGISADLIGLGRHVSVSRQVI